MFYSFWSQLHNNTKNKQIKNLEKQPNMQLQHDIFLGASMLAEF